MLWVSIFILLGLLLRKLKFPIRLTVVPLLLLLILSILRMLISVELPWAVLVWSETIYPAVVSAARFEIIPNRLIGIPITPMSIFIFIWIVGAVILLALNVLTVIDATALVKYNISGLPRDERAESVVRDLIGAKNRIRVFKTYGSPVPMVLGFSPYIILPDIDFNDDELRVIVAHEIKHCLDRDNLTKLGVGIVRAVFWWNPLFYILRQNVAFTLELKCDYYAVHNKEDFKHLESALKRMEKAYYARQKDNYSPHFAYLVSDKDALVDRLSLLAKRHDTPNTWQRLVNWGFSVLVGVIFFASYVFAVFPATMTSPDIPISFDCFRTDYYEDGGIYRAEENFIVDNGNGTFSLYIDGEFVQYSDGLFNGLEFFPIRKRGEE